MKYDSLLVILILQISYFSQSQYVPPWAVGKCVPKVSFTDCLTSSKKPRILYNTLRYDFEVTIEKGCKYSDVSNYWTLRKIETNIPLLSFAIRNGKATVVINKFQLSLGNYVLTSHVTESPRFHLEAYAHAECHIKMTSECPVPGIYGGTLRSVPLGQTLKVEAYAIRCTVKTSYSWKCTSEKPYPECQNLKSRGNAGEYLLLPIRGHVGDTIKVTVTAVAPLTRRRTFTQTIVIAARNTPQINIVCKKNCHAVGNMYSNPVVPIYLVAQCTYKCELLKRYKWDIKAKTSTVHPVEEIMANGTNTGIDINELIIEANWFNYEEHYSIFLLGYNDEEIIAKTMMDIKMAMNVAGKSKCTAKHNNRNGMDRMYSISCVVPENYRPVQYKLQQIYKDIASNQTLGYGIANNHVPHFNVRLASHGETKLQGLQLVVLDDTMVITNMTFYVEVPRSFGDIPDDEILAKITRIYSGAMGTMGIKLLLQLGRVQEASQIINILLCELDRIYKDNPETRRIVKSWQIDIMVELLTMDHSVSDYEFVLAVIPQLAPENPKGILHSKLRTRLCRTIAINLGAYIYQDEYPLCHQGYLEAWTIPLKTCAMVYLDDKYEKYTSFHIPLPDPIPEHLPYMEDYPNYGEFIDDATAEDLREIILNAIAIINIISRSYSRTFTIGEPRYYLNFTANTTIDVEYAENPKKIYEDDHVRVILPKTLNLKKDDHVYILVILSFCITYIIYIYFFKIYKYTSIPSSAFFWDKRTGNISETVLDVNIYGPNAELIEKYPKHMHLYFKLSGNQKVTVIDGKFSVSLEGNFWTEEYIHINKKVFRIELSKLDTLMTIFAEINPIQTLMVNIYRDNYEVAITKYHKPERKDFTFEVNANQPFSIAFNRSYEDSLFYIAILPSESDLKKFAGQQRRNSGPDYDLKFNDDYTASLNTLKQERLNITFKYAFTAMSCTEWRGELSANDNCDIGMNGNSSIMHCKCINGSSIVADMKNVRIIEETIHRMDYSLKITINVFVPITTALIIAIYCSFICLVYFRMKPRNLYFLGDNLEEDRYAYLVRVNTGAYNNASTTSNVTIKLHGERASSKTLTTYAICLAIIARPTFRLKDGFGENKFDDGVYIFTVSTTVGILVFCLYTPLAITFRYTPRRDIFFMHKDPQLSAKINKMCWIIVATVVCCCTTYIFYFGFWVSAISSWMWMVIANLSLVFNSTLLENLKLSLHKWITGWRIRKKWRFHNIKFDKIIAEVERQRRFVYGRLGRYGLRPFLTHLYKPLSMEKYITVSNHKIMEYKIGRSASDMIFFYVYACLLFFLLILKLNMMTYVSSNHIMELVMNGSSWTVPRAPNVKTLIDLYEYLNNTLAPVLHPMEWYGRWKVSEPGLLADYQTKIIGVARLRQKRVKEEPCPVRFFSRMINISSCYREYVDGRHDKSDAKLSKSMWSYQYADSANSLRGEIDSSYSGKGFIVKLGRNLNNTYYIIKLLKDANWITRSTRAIFLELWSYNANQNLFNAVTVIFERSATQLIIVTYKVVTLELMHTSVFDEIFTVILFALFCVFILRLILKYIRTIVRNRFRKFLTMTNLWEMTIIITNSIIVVLYLKQFDEHIDVLSDMANSKYNDFISYFRIMENYRLIRMITAVLFAMAIARGITFMKFVSIFKIFSEILRLSLSSFCGATIFTFLLVINFTLCGYLMFGSYSRNFGTLERAGFTLMMEALGIRSDFRETISGFNKVLGYIYYILFSISLVTLRTIYIVIVILYYEKSKEAMSRIHDPYTFTHFARDRWRYYRELFRRRLSRYRLKGGKDCDQVPRLATPKDDQFRYKDCILMSNEKIRFMNLTTRGIVRRLFAKRKATTDRDIDLMRKITISLLKNKDNLTSKSMFFFGGKDQGHNVKFVSNRKLLEMEYLVNYLLTPSKRIRKEPSHLRERDSSDQPQRTSFGLTDNESLKKMEAIESVLASINALVDNISVKKIRRTEKL